MPATVRGYGGVHDTDTSIDPNSQPGIPSNITGTTPGGYDPAYGGVPLIPDPTASAWQAIGGDLNSLPQAFTLGNAYNLFNFGQQQQTLQGTPSYQNVLDLMAGKLPQDVINQIAQQSAERGVSGGHPGDPNSNAAYLAAVGGNSLAAQAAGQQQYGALAGHYPMAAPFNLMDFLTTPEQQQAANTAANTNAAAPNPAEAARAEQAALLAAIAAGKGSVPPVGAAPGIPNLGSPAGSLSGPPPAQTMVGNSLASGITPNPNGSAGGWTVDPKTGYYKPPYPVAPNGPNTSGNLNGTLSGGYLSGLLNDPSLSLFGGNSSGSLNYAGGYQPDMAGMYSGTNQGGSGADPASQYWAWVMAHLNSPDFGGSPGGSGGGLGGGYLGNLGGGFGDFGGGYGDLGSLGTLGGSPQDTGSFNDFSGGGYDSNPATNNWWESSDPWGALTNTNWLTPPGSSGNMAGMEGSDFTNPGNLLGFDPNATEPDPYPYGDIFG